MVITPSIHIPCMISKENVTLNVFGKLMSIIQCEKGHANQCPVILVKEPKKEVFALKISYFTLLKS
jgi:hypothetical protein